MSNKVPERAKAIPFPLQAYTCATADLELEQRWVKSRTYDLPRGPWSRLLWADAGCGCKREQQDSNRLGQQCINKLGAPKAALGCLQQSRHRNLTVKSP